MFPSGEVSGVLQGGREPRGGGLTRVVDGRAVVVMVGGGAGGAGAVGHLLDVMVGGTLDVVYGPPWRLRQP